MIVILNLLLVIAISLAITSLVTLAFDVEPKERLLVKVTMAIVLNMPLVTMIVCFASILVYYGTLNELRSM